MPRPCRWRCSLTPGPAPSCRSSTPGELDFGINNFVDMALAYQGPERLKIGGQNPFPHIPNVRLVMRGSPFLVGLLVRKDSPIKTIYDIKGKRLTGEYPANWLSGITCSEPLLVQGSLEGRKSRRGAGCERRVDALVQGRADATQHALNSAKSREADAAIGVRHLSIDCSLEGSACGRLSLVTTRVSSRLEPLWPWWKTPASLRTTSA